MNESRIFIYVVFALAIAFKPFIKSIISGQLIHD